MKAKQILSRIFTCLIISCEILLSSCEKEEGCLVCLDHRGGLPHQYLYSGSSERQDILDIHDVCEPCGSGYDHYPADDTRSPEKLYQKKVPGD